MSGPGSGASALPWDCVIFDVDGTLIDSNDAHAHAWVDALAAFDIHVAFDKVRPLIGMGGDKLLPKVAGLRDDEPGGKDVVERRSQLFRERYLPTLRAFPLAQELLARMHGRGLRLIVASSAKDDELGALLDVAGVRGLIEHKTSSSDAEHSKPDPDIVVAALARAKVEARRAIMIGDTPYDLSSAAGAGVSLLAFRCGGGWTDDDFRGARAIYDGPADLFERFDVSPIVRG